MKKVLLVAAAILFVASVASAELPITPYLGLQVGPSTNSPAQTVPSGTCEVDYTGARTTFYMWIWILPNTAGMMAAEFCIELPAVEDNVTLSTATKNPLVLAVNGALTDGIAVSFGVCRTDWTWIYYVKAYLYDDVASTVRIVEDPTADPPFLGVSTCALGYPMVSGIAWSYLSMNHACTCIATKESSWGAIKSLF
ncbi:MAG: hypothetical protein PHD74_00605 [Candidatus Krumholzibacteria bacterium]|nr:hypothetical protein [Candidatus Krumholzibacteria bacterium]